MDTNEYHKLDAAKTVEVLTDGLRAAAYAGIQKPYEALKQASYNILQVNLPDSQIVEAPPVVPINSAAGVAESIGTVVGMSPWLYASHKIVVGVAADLGFSAERMMLSKSLSIARVGATGATFSTLFQPTEGKGNYFAEKAEDAGIAFATFATGAGLHSTIKPIVGTFGSRAINIGLSSTIGAISGGSAGVVNAELNNLSDREHVNPWKTGLEFGVLGAAVGSKLALVRESKMIGKEKMFSNRPDQFSTEGDAEDVFGERPQKLMANLEAVKSQYGENSPEHADYQMRIGDAHMRQGSLSNPEAQASYEQALKIISDNGQSNEEMGRIYDKLANVKESSDNPCGAATDLARAIEFWQKGQTTTDSTQTDYIAGRQDDLRRLQNVINVRYRTLPASD
jgi:hypothetical protein